MNSLTHGLGLVLGAAATTLLVILAAMQGDGLLVAGCAVFGGSVLLLYGASTVYHTARNETWKRRLQVFDHIAIYLLIAGTYTPFALGPLRGFQGLVLLAGIWLVALFGSLLELRWKSRPDWLSVLLYLAMGWLALLAFPSMRETLSLAAIVCLLAGGAAYTAGTAFYLWQRLPFHHGIWHIFVLLGTGSHFASILLFVLAAGA